MGNEALNRLRTDNALLDALRNAASRKQTAGEIQEQRVSFVFGSLDKDSGVTKDRIRQVIAEQEGLAA